MLTPLEVLRRYPTHDYTVNGVLASRAGANAERPLLLFDGRTLSYAEVMRRAEAAARALAARGIGPGMRVGVMAQNSAEYFVVLLALARLGAILVPVNPEFGAQEAGYILQHAEVRAVATTPAALEVARAATAPLSPAPWIFMLADLFSLDSPAGQSLPASPKPEATVLTLYTSGTTGFPKGVMHSQRNLVTAGEAFVARMWLQPEDRLMCILPMFHINALFYSVSGTLAAGASLALLPKFSASTFWKSAAETGGTELNVVAAIGNILARRPRSEFDPRHRIRAIYGGPISQEIKRIFQEEFKVPVLIEGYGMTEIPGAVNNPFDGEQRANSMGLPARHPDPDLEFTAARVMDDDGREVAPGVEGELWVKTPILMQGYFKDPQQTAASMHDGWFKTGDLVKRDADGYFYFIARKRDIIRRRGENISGAELDRVIGDHPEVVQAGAIGVPSELGEEEILVAVVRKPGARVTEREIADWCRARLTAIKVPRYVAFVESLPVTATQRVQKFILRKDEGLRRKAVDLQK